MANIASVLKIEISRIARKELRAETAAMRKTIGVYRTDMAKLKRQSAMLEQQVKRILKSVPAKATAIKPPADGKTKFSAKSLASQRRRLGLSAEDVGLLVGASAQSIYNWEQGKVRPHPSHLAALAALRSLGKKDAAAHVAQRSVAE